MESAISTVTNFASILTKKVSDISQGVQSYIPMPSALKFGLKKLSSLDERFSCPLHPPKLIKYFAFRLLEDDQLPPLLCEECLKNFEEQKPDGVPRFSAIKELPEYFISKYEDIKNCYDINNVNGIVLENYLQKEQQLQQQMAQIIEEEKQQLTLKINAAIELFTSQLNLLKDRLFSLLSSELDVFAENIAFTRKNIEKFLEYFKAFENLPRKDDLEKKIDDLSSYESLSSFIHENSAKLETLSSSLRNFESTCTLDNLVSQEYIEEHEHEYNEYTNRYKYALYLVRKVYQTIKRPPKLPTINSLEFESHEVDQEPTQLLVELLTQFANPAAISIIKLQDCADRLEKMITYEDFTRKLHHLEPFQIDTLDYFSSNISGDLQCLHYYNYEERVLYLISLSEVNLLARSPENEIAFSPILKIALPPSLKIARMAKTIASPEGNIYFIGGEDSSETIAFEYKASQPSPRKQNNDSNKSINEDQATLQIPLSYKRRRNLNTSDEIDVVGLGVFNVKARMSQARYGHSLVYAGNGSIYAIAGFELSREEDYSTKCERYIIKEDRWVSVADCNYGVSHPGLCVFDNKYIYKFGGFTSNMGQISNDVERYSTVKDKWTKVSFSVCLGDSMPFYPKSLPLQINDEEIIIVGGQTEAFLFSDKCYFLKVDKGSIEVAEGKKPLNKEENHEASDDSGTGDRQEMSLPMDGRMPYQCLIYDGKLFCLVIKPTKNEVIQNVFMYDGNQWGVVL